MTGFVCLSLCLSVSRLDIKLSLDRQNWHKEELIRLLEAIQSLL